MSPTEDAPKMSTRSCPYTVGRLSGRDGRQRLAVLVIMDDPLSIDPVQDTTTALIDELALRGHEVEQCMLQDLWLASDGLRAHTCAGHARRVSDFDAVLLRSNPPFDSLYLQATLLLEGVRETCLLVNDPRALRECNEKLYPLRFPHLTPPTMVSSQRSHLLQFLDDQGGRIIIKPTDGCGGDGIFIADITDMNLGAILASATAHGHRRVIAQRYLGAAAAEGDKRIILLDGEPIGAFLRRPAPGEARANLHAGGTAVLTNLTSRERLIAQEVGDRCRSEGLFLVGLDVIGGWLTEVNVTSPAGFRAYAQLTGVHLQGRVVDWLEERCRSYRVVARNPPTVAEHVGFGAYAAAAA